MLHVYDSHVAKITWRMGQFCSVSDTNFWAL